MTKLNSVPILGTKFSISYGKVTGGNYGETIGNKRQIKIDAKLKGEMLKSTQIHEILHGILHVSGIAEILEKYDGDNEGKLEEAVVVALEHGLTPIIEIKLDS
jgi:hypothetical protein